jgi:hypothetical protein
LTKTKSTTRPRNRADKLAKLGKTSGIALTEAQLGDATGGLIGLNKPADLKL